MSAGTFGDGPLNIMSSVTRPPCLQVLSKPLDLPAEGFPLEQACANHLRGPSGAQAPDLMAENVSIANSLAQYGIESLVQLFEGREEIGVELVDAAAARRGAG